MINNHVKNDKTGYILVPITGDIIFWIIRINGFRAAIAYFLFILLRVLPYIVSFIFGNAFQRN